MKETLEDTLNGVLDGMATEDIIVAWNEYCNHANYMDDYIYHNTPMFFEEHYHEGALYDLVKDIFYGRWNASDTLVKYSQQTGHLVSFTYLSEDASPYDQSSLVDWLIRTYGDDLESIGEFLGEDIEVDEGDTIYTVGDKTYKFCADDLFCCDNKCVELYNQFFDICSSQMWSENNRKNRMMNFSEYHKVNHRAMQVILSRGKELS